jgi:hypothetical protein
MSEDRKRGVIVLPKNCSTTIRKTIGRHSLPWHWKEDYYKEEEPVEFLGILRDPWKRYISGVLQGLRVKKFTRAIAPTNDENIRNPQNFYPPPHEKYRKHDYLFDQIFIQRRAGDWPRGIPGAFYEPYTDLTRDCTMIIDEHTVPQFILLGPFVGSKIKFIRMEDEHFNEELADWLGAPALRIDGLGTDKHPKFNVFFDYFEEQLLADKEWCDKWNVLFKEDWWVYKNKAIRYIEEYEMVYNQLGKRYDEKA